MTRCHPAAYAATMIHRATFVLTAVPTAVLTAVLMGAAAARAEVYAYVNDDGDYVVTRERPADSVGEYAILSNDGEFLRLVNPRELDVPITHWRPWFLPKQPDPFDADPDVYREREGTVEIEELDVADED